MLLLPFRRRSSPSDRWKHTSAASRALSWQGDSWERCFRQSAYRNKMAIPQASSKSAHVNDSHLHFKTRPPLCLAGWRSEIVLLVWEGMTPTFTLPGTVQSMQGTPQEQPLLVCLHVTSCWHRQSARTWQRTGIPRNYPILKYKFKIDAGTYAAVVPFTSFTMLRHQPSLEYAPSQLYGHDGRLLVAKCLFCPTFLLWMKTTSNHPSAERHS